MAASQTLDLSDDRAAVWVGVPMTMSGNSPIASFGVGSRFGVKGGGETIVVSYSVAMGRTDTASRVIAASRVRVYAALVAVEALSVWLPPDGMTGTFERFDARPGGSYRLKLTYHDASSTAGKSTVDSDVVEARFVELVPGVRVVQAVDFVSDDPSNAGTMTMIWDLAESEGATRVTVRAENVPDGISAADHAAGIDSSLANLANYLTR